MQARILEMDRIDKDKACIRIFFFKGNRVTDALQKKKGAVCALFSVMNWLRRMRHPCLACF